MHLVKVHGFLRWGFTCPLLSPLIVTASALYHYPYHMTTLLLALACCTYFLWLSSSSTALSLPPSLLSTSTPSFLTLGPSRRPSLSSPALSSYPYPLHSLQLSPSSTQTYTISSGNVWWMLEENYWTFQGRDHPWIQKFNSII